MRLKEIIVAPPHTIGEGSVIVQLDGNEINCIEAALRHFALENPDRDWITSLSQKWTNLCDFVSDGELK